MEVDKVTDMEVGKVTDMEVGKVTDMVTDMADDKKNEVDVCTVSYTHLTLPTTPYV